MAMGSLLLILQSYVQEELTVLFSVVF